MSAPSPQTQTWYLLKHGDNNIFGPASFDQLRLWAMEAQVSPLDKVSTDQTSWVRAPMLPDLGMDWLVEVTPEHCYGPTTLGSVRDFFLRGEIGPETVLINARDGSNHQVADIPELVAPPPEEPEEEPVAAGDPLVTAGQSSPETEFAEVVSPEADAGEATLQSLEETGSGETADGPPAQPARTGAFRFSLQQRVRELESSLAEERRLLTELSQRYAELESKYVRLLGHQRASANAGGRLDLD